MIVIPNRSYFFSLGFIAAGLWISYLFPILIQWLFPLSLVPMHSATRSLRSLKKSVLLSLLTGKVKLPDAQSHDFSMVWFSHHTFAKGISVCSRACFQNSRPTYASVLPLTSSLYRDLRSARGRDWSLCSFSEREHWPGHAKHSGQEQERFSESCCPLPRSSPSQILQPRGLPLFVPPGITAFNSCGTRFDCFQQHPGVQVFSHGDSESRSKQKQHLANGAFSSEL